MKRVSVSMAIGMWLAVGGISLAETVPPRTPYPQLFGEVVKIVEEHFYNPEQIARDFPALQATYREKLDQVATPQEFAKLVNGMLHELKASHTYYLTPDDVEYYQLGSLFARIPAIGAVFDGREVLYPSVGVLTQTIEGHVYAVCVLAGSTAEKAGLLKGDEIVSVNGAPYAPIASLRPLVGRTATFTIRRQAQKEPLTLEIVPALVNPNKEFLEAQRASIRIVEQAGKRIGYIHLYSYAGEEFHQELMNAVVWGELKTADALIVDLRYGLGGAWLYYLNLFNRQIPVFETYDRNGTRNVVDSQWRKPAVYLVNGYSRSGKELLAFGARAYKLATVIGERTAGQTRGGRLFPLSNGDLLFLAIQRSKIDGVDLEGVGVTPDIEVPFDVRHCAGHDLQLERAIEYLAEQTKPAEAPAP